MSLESLKLPEDTLLSKKQPTPFEQKRAAANTYEELVELGYESGMVFPKEWAQRVLDARNNN